MTVILSIVCLVTASSSDRFQSQCHVLCNTKQKHKGTTHFCTVLLVFGVVILERFYTLSRYTGSIRMWVNWKNLRGIVSYYSLSSIQ